MYHAAASIGDAESYIAKRAMGQSAPATDEFLGYYSPHLREFLEQTKGCNKEELTKLWLRGQPQDLQSAQIAVLWRA